MHKLDLLIQCLPLIQSIFSGQNISDEYSPFTSWYPCIFYYFICRNNPAFLAMNQQTMIDIGLLLGLVGLFVEVIRVFNKVENRSLLTKQDVNYLREGQLSILQRLEKIEIKLDSKQTRS